MHFNWQCKYVQLKKGKTTWTKIQNIQGYERKLCYILQQKDYYNVRNDDLIEIHSKDDDLIAIH